ncbi:Hypp9403 [Branchiostoma lanceolatum]|uniref:Hypp9403 protein n=1 Tax=Branchiostoma lanceolatum TaxID=7740 RepID=A0A8S4MMM8_BRALA|nr:Hypp9403 [Branchiostoma lanceolatum]
MPDRSGLCLPPLGLLLPTRHGAEPNLPDHLGTPPPSLVHRTHSLTGWLPRRRTSERGTPHFSTKDGARRGRIELDLAPFRPARLGGAGGSRRTGRRTDGCHAQPEPLAKIASQED